mgnify:CR=1 FL=1
MLQYASELKLPNENNVCYVCERTAIHPKEWKTLSLGFGLKNAPPGIIIGKVKKCVCNSVILTNNIELTIDVFNPTTQTVYLDYGDELCQIIFYKQEEFKIWQPKTN